MSAIAILSEGGGCWKQYRQF